MENELTPEYVAYQAAEAAWNSDEMNLDKLNAYEAAYAAYLLAVKAARLEFEALPDDDAKSSAIENAYDTPGTADDELFWFRVARRSYDL